jgi:hypothetical protein
MAEPSPLLVQFPHVVSPPAVENMPYTSRVLMLRFASISAPRPAIRLTIERNADYTAQVAFFGAFLRIACDVYLSLRITMAAQA